MEGINTNLLFQYLSGAGAALSQGQSVAPALNQITQQQIASQSYAGLLKQILGGGGKVTMDKDKFSIAGPATALNISGASPVDSGDPASAGLGGVGGVKTGTAPAPAQNQTETGNDIGSLRLLQQLLNPQSAL